MDGSSSDSPAQNAEKQQTTKTPTDTSTSPKPKTKPEESPAKQASDEAEPMPSPLMQKVRDVDGIQLIVKRRLSATMSTPSDDSIRSVEQLSVASSHSKPIEQQLDPQHYRKLVKGLIPLRSSFMRPSIDQTSDSEQRKSVHFSDQSGFDLSTIRNYDKPVGPYVLTTLTICHDRMPVSHHNSI